MRRSKLLLWVIPLVLGAAAQAAPRNVGSYVVTPDVVTSASGKKFEIERGLVFVPENRNNPNSRTIAVHFVRLPALTKNSDAKHPPIFMLPGGPGSEFNFADERLQKTLQNMRRTRDVIYVSQRGNPRQPGLTSALRIYNPAAPLDQPLTAASIKASTREAFTAAMQEWKAKGVDLRGYDIINIVDDVYDLRAALGYDKIVLRGCSFGSQWSFSYLKRWPQTVDRAWLSGVEPLDYAYDSPAWLWASMERLAKQADADPTLKKHLPKGGVMEVLRTVITRLEAKPATVAFLPPGKTEEVRITVGAEDLRQTLQDAPGTSARDELTNWPRMLLEMYAGDYRYLAAKSWERRSGGAGEPLILPLIDNSLGITAARDAKLLAEPEARWLGDINDFYHNTRDITPTPRVDDAFRADWRLEMPVLLTNGDLDWSTPIENAKHARGFLAQGHLVEIGGATHCTETPELPELLPDLLAKLNQFYEVDFAKTPATDYFKTLPSSVSYPTLKFRAPTAPSTFDEWRANAKK
ncbi:alpha/beta fold hydrolase [Steroidobacter sp.]|uniref:alpha/beta fold hydrolase n=1 Tax=Steroidobacter sp. TaxID=1978227 RepID=UPI001A634E05|nr:alpha/beta fold hydrolase [Steroidobacter sp.]MBL8264791.1 alpha/beta fold hydrolase [Steroidobacter sp.]